MCIRDRTESEAVAKALDADPNDVLKAITAPGGFSYVQRKVCLLYTSDAADERSSVDLGGRRIIKKKKHMMTTEHRQHTRAPLQRYWQQRHIYSRLSRRHIVEVE